MSGRHDDRHVRSLRADSHGDTDAVDRTGHLNVREQDVEIGAGGQDQQRRGAVHGLNDHRASALEEIGDDDAHQGVILDHKHDRLTVRADALDSKPYICCAKSVRYRE